MKKLLALAIALSMTVSAIPAFAASSDDEPIYITDTYSVKEETTIPLIDAPALIIEADSAYNQNFSFEISLTGAKFENYAANGTLAGTKQGVTYIKINDSKLRLNVDTKLFDMTKNNLEIPLYTTLIEEGDITLFLEPKDSPLPSTSLTFANLSEKKYGFEISTVKSMDQQSELSDIIIRDKTTDFIEADTVFTLQIDNNFLFTGEATVTGTDKFKDVAKFEVDKKDASTAYITITKRTDNSAGNLVISHIGVNPQSSKSVFGPVNIKLSWPNDSATIEAATYIPKTSYSTGIAIENFEGGYKPTASGTAAGSKMLQIQIDGDDYGEITSKEDGTWVYEFPFEYSNLKPGKHTFAVGYYQKDANHFFDSVTREFEIAEEKTTTTVTFTVDSTTYKYGDKDAHLDAPAFIDANGRTMLPLRAVSATLGVASDDVKWEPDTQTVTIKKDDKTVVCQISKQELTVNGLIVKMDTAAVIVDGRTFLPLRPLLNALGVSDDNIKWDKDLKAVTFEV